MTIGLSGCGVSLQKLMDDADYWERLDPRDALYMDGPALQKRLNLDIAQCVTALREREATDALKVKIPAESTPDAHPSPEAGRLADWDTPERDGYLYAEHMPFHDFESCMLHKGWERTDRLTRPVAHDARKNFIDNLHPSYKRRLKVSDTDSSSPSSGSSSGGSSGKNSYLDF